MVAPALAHGPAESATHGSMGGGPIAYTYASRDAESIEPASQLKFSLAVDPVRFREWLTRSFEEPDGNQPVRREIFDS